MQWKAPWAARLWAEAVAPVRREAAHEALVEAGASDRAAILLIEAGYTSADSFLKAPWGAREAGGKYESAEWRLSVQRHYTPDALKEAGEFRERLVAAAAARRRPGSR